MAERFRLPVEALLDTDVNALAGGSLTFYLTLTTTLETIYTNDDLTIPANNPYTLDSVGQHGDIFLGGADYRVIVKNAAGSIVPGGDIDPVHGSAVVVSGEMVSIGIIANMTALTKDSLADGQQVTVGGYATLGDGGGGLFYWDAASTATIDGGTVFFADEGGTGRWKRIYSGPFNVKWFGAKGDGTTDDHAALNSCFVTAVASSQTGVHVPVGTYMLSQTLNISNVSVFGDGAVGSTFKPSQPFTGSAVLLLDDSTGGGGGVNSSYQNFRVHGNRSALSTTVAGLKLLGNVLYCNFSNIRINEVKGVGVLLDGEAGPERPSLLTFINVTVNGGDTHGWELKAGRNIDMIDCSSENLTGMGWNLSASTEEVGRIGLIRPWVENVVSNGFYIGTGGDIEIIAPNIGGYGATASASYGIRWAACTRGKLVGGDFSKNASPHASSRHILIDGGDRIILENLSSAISSAELEITGNRGVVVNGSFNVVPSSKTQVIFTNGVSSIAASASYYITPNSGAQMATYAEARALVCGYTSLSELRMESATVVAGGAATYTVTIYVDGIATAMTATTAAGGGTASNLSNEVLIAPGSTWALFATASAGAATIPLNCLHVTVGERK